MSNPNQATSLSSQPKELVEDEASNHKHQCITTTLFISDELNHMS